jgi:hypothetical protein
MRLEWQKDAESPNRYNAESFRYRFILLTTTTGKANLWVQSVDDKWGTKAIDTRSCRSIRHAERLAQRFEDSGKARRLR